MNRIIETGLFKIHKIEVSIRNSYLVESSSGLCIIDPGAYSDIKIIIDYMRDTLSAGPCDLKFSIISHMHPDHSGGSAALRDKYNIPIAAFHNIHKWYSGITGLIQYMLDCYMTHGVARKQKTRIDRVRFKRKIKPDYILTDNAPLPFFTEWKSYHIPGHTNHDVVIYNPQNKILFASDSIIGARGKQDLPMPIVFRKLMKKSYMKLSEIPASIIFLGHGDMIKSDDSKKIFLEMAEKLKLPLSKLSKQVHLLSFYSPQIRRTWIKNHFIK